MESQESAAGSGALRPAAHPATGLAGWLRSCSDPERARIASLLAGRRPAVPVKLPLPGTTPTALAAASAARPAAAPRPADEGSRTRPRITDLVARLRRGQEALQQLAAGGGADLRPLAADGLTARHELAALHTHLVHARARSFARRVGRSWLPDLLQQGWLGLCRACERFDPARGTRFDQYAHFWVLQSMQRFLAEHRRMIRLPNHVLHDLLRLQSTRARLRAAQGWLGAGERTALARELGMSVARVGFLENVEREPEALDQHAPEAAASPGSDAPDEVSRTPADEHDPGPFAAASTAELGEQLERLLQGLSFQQREVVKLRFGVGDGYDYTLEEIGRVFQLTRERIRQIEHQALERLRHPRRARILQAFLPGAAATARP